MAPNIGIALLVLNSVLVSHTSQQFADEVQALDSEDECSVGQDSDCALHALQQRIIKQSLRQAEVTSRAVQQAASAGAAQASAEDKGGAEAEAEAEVEAAAESARALLSPRHRYNSSAFGGRRAPAMATAYDGLEDRRHFEVSADAAGLTHVFGIGDWGAMLPSHTTAPNKRGPGRKCPDNCGYVPGIDDRAQLLVASVMKKRAGTSNPQYVLNVGDNFYWAGIWEDCKNGKKADGKTFKSFSSGWTGIYGGLASKPWISCLGNHDYGGRRFDRGWPQQIGYSFVNKNWVMPARYYKKVMSHPGYSVEYFVIDSNAWDAKEPDDDPEHNICSDQYNPASASCASAGGPPSKESCRKWFWSSYHEQKAWLKAQVAASKASWQVVVTHFPCGTDAGFYAHLHKAAGLDLLVTGHRHDQELWAGSAMLGGLTCFVTGGGGGVTSEHSPSGEGSSQYGFFDLTFSKEKLKIESIALDGHVLDSTWVYPK